VRLDDGWLSRVNSCLGELDPARISKLDWAGNVQPATHRPRKPSCRSMYEERPSRRYRASTHSAAVSCLCGLDPASCIRLTPYPS
jgi:hypothetical protein